MVNIRNASMDQATREPRPGFIRALGGPQFLAAQFFTILATVIGVYLAGYVGFQRTLEYDRFQKAQQQSDLFQSMAEELKQNVARLRKFDERLPGDTGYGLGSAEWPRMRLFIWQAAGRSSSLFDTPPQILADMQAFYEDISEMLVETEARESFRSLTTSNTNFRRQYKEKLAAKLNHAEKVVLPALANAQAEAADIVKKYSAAMR